MDIISKFSERIKEIMFESDNMTNETLGKAIDVSDETVRLWKNGERYISLSQLLKLADYFQCSIEFLIGRSDTQLDYIPKPCPPFYNSLRAIMEEKKITRYKIVKNTKIYDSYFTNWKNGSDPHVLTLVTLADFFDCTIDYLIGRDI